jgi:FG-GAP-like repeat
MTTGPAVSPISSQLQASSLKSSSLQLARTVIMTCLLAASLSSYASTQPDFVAPRTFDAGESAVAMAAADFNGDGKLDVVVANATLNVIFGNGNGTFQPPVSYAMNAPALAMAVGDFNHDGRPDLAVGSGLGIAIFINTGTGAFNSPIYYEVGATNSIAVGDINGDHFADLIYEPYYEFQTVYTMTGNGDGTFNAQQSTPIPGCPTGLTAGDFNNDGKIDIAAANAVHCDNLQGYQITILTGNGDGSFQSPHSYRASGLYALTPAVGDFNKDGNLDLAAVIQGSNAIDVFLGNGDGTLQHEKTFAVDSYPTNLVIADFNGDGFPDIAVTEGEGDVGVLLGNGLGNFAPPAYYEAGYNLLALAAGDFRTSGKQDIVTDPQTVSFDEGSLSLLVNLGGTFRGARNYRPSIDSVSMSVGDFNGDGFNDIVEGQSGSGSNVSVEIGVLLNNGKGGFKNPVITSLPTALSSGSYIATGDFNKDGKLDVAVSLGAVDGKENVTILLGNGDGTFTLGTNYDLAAGIGPAAIVSGDFNHDGNLDLLAICGYQACLMTGNGNGTFTPGVPFSLGGSQDVSPTNLAVGDVNHDNHLDLAVTFYLSDTVAVVLGNGDGTFQTPSTFTDKEGPTDVLFADFNKDGNLDLAVADENTDFGLLLGNGDGTFRAEQHFSMGARAVFSLSAADFDGDGNLDVGILNSQFPDSLLILHGRGDGTFKPPVPYPVPFDAVVSAVTSFTNSGAPDVAITGEYGDVTVYLNTRDF